MLSLSENNPAVKYLDDMHFLTNLGQIYSTELKFV